MIKECPRCQRAFECKNDNILECDCVKVVISKETYDYISQKYDDCLCINCLKEIEKERATAFAKTLCCP